MMPLFVSTRIVRDLLRAAKQREGAVVARLAAAHARMQAADGLDVVVEDIGPRADHRGERLLLDAEEVGRQHLDRRLGHLAPQRADRRRVVPGAAVGDVVAVDRRDDDVAQAHLPSPSGRAAAARAGRRARSACRSARSSSGRRGCRCRRGSGRSPCRGPSTRRCSGSAPPRRSCSGLRRGSAS